MVKRKAAALKPEPLDAEEVEAADNDGDFLDSVVPSASTSKGKGKAGGTRAPRQKKSKTEPEEEKRLARWKPKCPQATRERVARVLAQRFFLLSREKENGDYEETFKVLGSTGNVYTVRISALPCACDCPDGSKGNHCKHILFVYIKVLSVDYNNSALYYQKALLSDELKEIFDNAPASPQDVNARAAAVYKKVTAGEPVEDEVSEARGKRRLPEEGDDCPICYDSLPAGTANGLVFCEDTCGGPIHAVCFNQWAAISRGKGEAVKCVFCRALWPAAASDAAGPSTTMVDGYVNLAGMVGISTKRDTSSYYRRGYGRY